MRKNSDEGGISVYNGKGGIEEAANTREYFFPSGARSFAPRSIYNERSSEKSTLSFHIWGTKWKNERKRWKDWKRALRARRVGPTTITRKTGWNRSREESDELLEMRAGFRWIRRKVEWIKRKGESVWGARSEKAWNWRSKVVMERKKGSEGQKEKLWWFNRVWSHDGWRRIDITFPLVKLPFNFTPSHRHFLFFHIHHPPSHIAMLSHAIFRLLPSSLFFARPTYPLAVRNTSTSCHPSWLRKQPYI